MTTRGRSRLRELVRAWWHGDDVETALGELRVALDEVGLDDVALPEALVRRRTAELADADEEIARWHQIGIVAVTANTALRARGSERRVAALGRAARWETDEPAWVLVESAAELARLRAEYGAPEGLEAAYDAAASPDEVPADFQAAVDENPYLAVLKAQAAARAGRWAEALALAEVGLADGSHGIIAEVVRIEALVALDRLDDARAAWEASATAWLAGRRAAFDTQWAALARLHDRTGRPADELTRAVATRAVR